MKRNILIIFVVAALLFVVSCSDKADTSGALPDWFANKTWASTQITTYDNDGQPQESSLQLYVITSANDTYITSDDVIGGMTGLKAQIDALDGTYKEYATSTSYTLEVSYHVDMDLSEIGQGPIEGEISGSYTFTKTGEITMSMAITETYNGVSGTAMTGTFVRR